MTYTPKIVNIGTAPNSKDGDPLRVAYDKINDNFEAIFETSFNNSFSANTSGNIPEQVIYSTPSDSFRNGDFSVKTSDDNESQTIKLSAQLVNGNVSFTGYGSTFSGPSLATYDFDVFSGNVRLLCSPLLNVDMTHIIEASVRST